MTASDEAIKAMERRLDEVALRCERLEIFTAMVEPRLRMMLDELESLGYLSTQSNTATATARSTFPKLWELTRATREGEILMLRGYGEGRALKLRASLIVDSPSSKHTAGGSWTGHVESPLGAGHPHLLQIRADSLHKLLTQVELELDLS